MMRVAARHEGQEDETLPSQAPQRGEDRAHAGPVSPAEAGAPARISFVPERVVHQHQRNHGFDGGDRPGKDAGVVTAIGTQRRVLSEP